MCQLMAYGTHKPLTDWSVHEQFMDRAIVLGRLALQEGDGPVGCVIVKHGELVGQGRNLVVTQSDPSAHGEIIALRDVSQRLGRAILHGTTLYTSMEPCPACARAIVESGISTVVVGARHADFITREHGSFSIESVLSAASREIHLISGVRAAECRDLRYAALEQSVRAQRGAGAVGSLTLLERISRWLRRLMGIACDGVARTVQRSRRF